MKIERLETGSVAVLRLEGSIDEEGMRKVRLALDKCMCDDRSNVVINMSAVHFTSYMGLGVLLECLQQCRRRSGDLRFSGVSVSTQRLFRSASLHKTFASFESEELAIRSFRQAA